MLARRRLFPLVLVSAAALLATSAAGLPSPGRGQADLDAKVRGFLDGNRRQWRDPRSHPPQAMLFHLPSTIYHLPFTIYHLPFTIRRRRQ